jgi:uncharacterized protein (TIGR02996 family)
MTHEQGSLLRAVLLDPGDDGPRLVYADWLDEHGEHDRAEFIRVEIELLTAPREYDSFDLDIPAGRYAQLLKRRHRLLVSKAAENEWPVPAARIRNYAWDRGFVGEVACTAADFLAHAAALFAAHPIVKVTLSDLVPSRRYNVSGNPWLWYLDIAGDLVGPNAVPHGIWPYLGTELEAPPGFAYYSHPNTAKEYLGQACVAYGRQQAGLPPLPADDVRNQIPDEPVIR